MSVMGSRYTAGLWVTGQISRTGSRGAFALGKKRSKVSSSVKETKVREHFPLQAGAAAASACCGSWSNLEEMESALRDARRWGNPGSPAGAECGAVGSASPNPQLYSASGLGMGAVGETSGIPSSAPNYPSTSTFSSLPSSVMRGMVTDQYRMTGPTHFLFFCTCFFLSASRRS